MGHPGHTVTDAASVPRPLESLPSTFIAGKDWLSFSREQDLLKSLRRSPRWTFRSIEGGHWPMLTVPETLASLLLEIPLER